MSKVGKLQPTGKSGLPPVPINKVLLGHSHTHSLTYCLWLLCPYSSREKPFDRP